MSLQDLPPGAGATRAGLVTPRVAGSLRSRLERRLVAWGLRSLGSPPLILVLPDGTEIGAVPARHRVELRTHRAVAAVARRSSVAIGDCYRDGEIEVAGDLAGLLADLNRRLDAPGPRRRPWWPARRISPAQAARNARQHYEVGQDFFAAWLDPGLTYTCAYYPTETASLEEAQVAKMERVCRKLDLRAGERVVEAGCGWGALAIYMAARHGVRVRAFNTSAEQVQWATRKARRLGVAALVEFVAEDYRAIREEADAFVSVGMLEHVGAASYPEFGAIVSRTIGTRGRGLLHTIGRASRLPTDPWIQQRIFPGGYVPSFGELANVVEPAGLAVLHLENLRQHYARTLEHWRLRFEEADRDGRLGGDRRRNRAWRLYLAASEAAFRTGWAQLYQVVVASRRNVEFSVPPLDAAPRRQVGPDVSGEAQGRPGRSCR